MPRLPSPAAPFAVRATCVLMLGLGGPLALAQSEDTYVPGTSVSYNYSRYHDNGNFNSSVLYVDEVNDSTNKNYVGFQCMNSHQTYFFLSSKNPLVTEQMLESNTSPTLTYQVDGGPVKSLNTVPWGKGADFNPNRLLVEEENDPLMLKLFRESKSRVVLKVKRPGQSDLTFTFATTGFERGYQAVEACR